MFLPGLLRFVVCFVPFEIHQVKIDIFSIDLEKMGKRIFPSSINLCLLHFGV